MFGRVYTAITLVFFVFLIAFGVFRLRAERSERLEDAETRYSILASAVKGGLAGNNGTPPERIAAAVRPRIDHASGLAVYVVYTIDRGIEYLWSRDSGLLSAGAPGIDTARPNSPGSLIGATSLTRASFSSPIRADGTSPVYIADASFDVLPSAAVATVLRESLLILLVYLGATITALVVFVLRSRIAEAVETTETASSESTGGRLTTGKISSAPGATSDKRIHEAAADRSEPATATAVKSGNDDSDAPQDVAPASTIGPPPGAPEAAAATAEVAGRGAVTPQATETGLFDPETGIGYRKHFEPRLSLELDRAAENDDDLCLMLVRSRLFDEPTQTELYRILIHTYEYQDLVFHYDNNGIAVVLPRTSLTEALASAEDFVATCHEHKLTRPFAGLSSRNGRIIEAGRLIAEAEGALSKAQSESARIVGFHSDPQAYRSFLSRGGRQSPIITGP